MFLPGGQEIEHSMDTGYFLCSGLGTFLMVLDVWILDAVLRFEDLTSTISYCL